MLEDELHWQCTFLYLLTIINIEFAGVSVVGVYADGNEYATDDHETDSNSQESRLQ